MSEDTIQQIAHPERSNLPERERLALQFAELYITSPESVTDELVDELKRHFSEGQLVEMMFFVGTYNMLHRFNAAIDIPPRDGDNLVVVSIEGYGDS